MLKGIRIIVLIFVFSSITGFSEMEDEDDYEYVYEDEDYEYLHNRECRCATIKYDPEYQQAIEWFNKAIRSTYFDKRIVSHEHVGYFPDYLDSVRDLCNNRLFGSEGKIIWEQDFEDDRYIFVRTVKWTDCLDCSKYRRPYVYEHKIEETYEFHQSYVVIPKAFAGLRHDWDLVFQRDENFLKDGLRMLITMK